MLLTSGITSLACCMGACKLNNCLGHHNQKPELFNLILVIRGSTISTLLSLLPPHVQNMHHEEQHITSVPQNEVVS